MGQVHLSWLHTALVNLPHGEGLPHASPRLAQLHFEHRFSCYGACKHGHGDVAVRALQEPGRPRHGDGRVHAVEIGTYFGETALRLLSNVPDLNLLMVDPFEEANSFQDAATEHEA